MLKRKRGDGDATSSSAPSGVGGAELNYLELSFAKVPIFSACSTDELLRVAGLCTLRDAEPGDAVVTEGDIGVEFFVILRGNAVVTRGEAEVGRLEPGDFFGELALFDPAPRNATVRAVDALSLAVLTKPAFRQALQDAPIRESVFLGMARRLHDLDAST
jgi:CRP-like cAMP-binding protein